MGKDRGEARRPRLSSIVARDSIEGIGFGVAQLRVLLLACGVWLADGVELTLVCNVLTVAASKEFGLTAGQNAVLTSTAILGVALGCLVGGWLSDRVGRKMPIVLSYLGTGVFDMASALAVSYRSLLILRLAIGFSVGLGMPPSVTMLTECTPRAWRPVMNAARDALFCTGEVYASMFLLIADPGLLDADWRWLLTVSAYPPLALGMFALGFLSESPVFLAGTGSPEEAKLTLDSMARANNKDPVGVDDSGSFRGLLCKPDPGGIDGKVHAPLRQKLSIVFGPQLKGPTMALVLCTTAVNMGLYGVGYAESQVLVINGDNIHLSPGMQMLLANIVAYVGCTLTVVSGWIFSDRATIAGNLALTGATMVVFGLSVTRVKGRPVILELLFQASICGLRIFPRLVFNYSYQVSAELYPIVASSMGTAVIIGAGWLGGIASAMVFESTYSVFRNEVAFYILVGSMTLLSSILVATLLPSSASARRKAATKAADLSEGLSPAYGNDRSGSIPCRLSSPL